MMPTFSSFGFVTFFAFDIVSHFWIFIHLLLYWILDLFYTIFVHTFSFWSLGPNKVFTVLLCFRIWFCCLRISNTFQSRHIESINALGWHGMPKIFVEDHRINKLPPRHALYETLASWLTTWLVFTSAQTCEPRRLQLVESLSVDRTSWDARNSTRDELRLCADLGLTSKFERNAETECAASFELRTCMLTKRRRERERA